MANATSGDTGRQYFIAGSPPMPENRRSVRRAPLAHMCRSVRGGRFVRVTFCARVRRPAVRRRSAVLFDSGGGGLTSAATDAAVIARWVGQRELAHPPRLVLDPRDR